MKIINKIRIQPSEFFTYIINDIKLVYQVLTNITKQNIHSSTANANISKILHVFVNATEPNKWNVQDELLDIGRQRISILKNKYDLDFERERAKAAYSLVFNLYYNQLGHYFRHLYHILKHIFDTEKREEKYILNKNNIENCSKTGYYYYQLWKQQGNQSGLDDSKMDKVGKTLKESLIINHRRFYDYASKIQAQMSEHELVVLFYNALIYPKMEHLLYHYNFIRNIFVQDLIESNHINFYEKKTILVKNYGYQEIYSDIDFEDNNRDFDPTNK